MSILILRAAGGGGAVDGLVFVPETGFTVTPLDGNWNQGSRISIQRSSGSWPTRTYSESPWLYDVGAAAYVDGTEVTPLASLSDGDLVPVSPAGGVWTTYGQDVGPSAPNGHRIRLARAGGARNSVAPNANTSAWFYATTGHDNMKCEVMEALWPTGGSWGSFNNPATYGSMSIRFKNINQCLGNGKYGRFTTSGGANYFYPGGSNTELGNIEATGPLPSEQTWFRVEFYLDLDLNVLDIWGGYRYQRQIESFGTTPGPREWRSSTPYNVSSAPGGYLYTNGANNTPMSIDYAHALVGALGFDGQSNNNFVGVEMDLANIFLDTQYLGRPEISDSATWDLQPNDFGTTSLATPREPQGRFLRDTNQETIAWLNWGQFSTKAGKHLHVTSSMKTSDYIGRWEAA